MSIFPMSTLGPLGAQRSQRTPWWLSGGISAANCIAAYQPKGAASLSASYANLANPGTYTAAPGVAPTWDAVSGWIFNGIGQYLTTGIVIGSNYSCVFRFSGSSSSGGRVVGVRNGPNGIFMNTDNGGNQVAYRYGDAVVNTSPSLANGVLSISGVDGYRNGFLDISSLSGTSVGVYGITIGAINADGVVSNFWPGHIQAICFYNRPLTADENLAIYIAMNAL